MFTDKQGRLIRIELDEELCEATAYHQRVRIGHIRWSVISNEAGSGYVVSDAALLTHIYLDDVPGYTNAGIGTEIVKLIRENTDLSVLVCRDTGQPRDDGAHPTGDANSFYRSLVRKGLAKWEDGDYDEQTSDN